jgi:hypothetical protein
MEELMPVTDTEVRWGVAMAENRHLQLTLELQARDREGVIGAVTESKTFETGDVEAQRAWLREVQFRWSRAQIVNEHSQTGTALMQVVDEMRCAHENLAHECPLCADM